MFGGLFLDFRLKKRECLFEIIDKDNITFWLLWIVAAFRFVQIGYSAKNIAMEASGQAKSTDGLPLAGSWRWVRKIWRATHFPVRSLVVATNRRNSWTASSKCDCRGALVSWPMRSVSNFGSSDVTAASPPPLVAAAMFCASNSFPVPHQESFGFDVFL